MFDTAVSDLTPALALFEQTQQERELAQTYLALGTAHQWQGYLAESRADFAGAVDYYQQALVAYNQCLALGKTTGDTIIEQDFAARRCEPYSQWVQGRLDALQ